MIKPNKSSYSFLAPVVISLSALLANVAEAALINTNDAAAVAAFSNGAQLQDFENVNGVAALLLNSYDNATNSSTTIGGPSQLSLDIPGLLFHSGGGSFNDPVGNPGTPTALLALGGAAAGDAQSGVRVVGSLEINSNFLDLDQFIEIVFADASQAKVGFWLNAALGDAFVTAFDVNGLSLETLNGTAGNFVGFDRAAADIHFISVVGGASGFTIDDLTYSSDAGGSTDPVNAVPEPTLLGLLLIGLAGMVSRQRAAAPGVLCCRRSATSTQNLSMACPKQVSR